VGDALRETALGGRCPVLHRAGGGGEGGAFANAHQHAHQEERHQPVDKAGQHRGQGPDHAAPEQRLAGAEAVAHPTAEHLENQIGIGEGREDQAQLGVAEAELALDLAGGGGDVDPVDIGDEVHQAQQPKHDVRHAEQALHPNPFYPRRPRALCV
jgi:hypothetical protein